MDNLRDQGYDGASTMSGVKAGVQAKIQEKQPKALYTHCAGHSLNLAILNSCSIPSHKKLHRPNKRLHCVGQVFSQKRGSTQSNH